MADKSDALLRLEKILHRFGDAPEEADVAFTTFRRLMEAERIRAPDLRLDLDGENRSSADALLRAFARINTPTKQQIRDLEAKIAQLEKENSKLKSELKLTAEEMRDLRSIKKNYQKIKVRQAAKAVNRETKRVARSNSHSLRRPQSTAKPPSLQLELSVQGVVTAES